jgi:hypothetical protein
MPTSTFQGRVTILNGSLIYSPNSQRDVQPPPTMSPHQYLFRGFSLDVDNYTQPRMWTDAYGWISFVQPSPRYEGPVFDRLNGVLRIVRNDLGYHLHPDIADSWARLENKLVFATVLVSKYFRMLSDSMCLPALRPPLPRDLGYNRFYKSLFQACHQIALSRNWFHMWAGLLSFLVAQACDDTHGNIPKWVYALADAGFPQIWLSSIISSTVTDFSPEARRTGIFLDLLKPSIGCTKQPPVSFFLSRNVPVWYRWTEREAAEARHDSRFALLAPPSELLQSINTSIARSPQDNVPSHLESSAVSKMTWKQFLFSRAQRQAEKTLTETPEHRRRRMQRERDRPISKAKVFTWDYNHEDPPWRVRTCVAQKFNRSTIESYGSRQRIYNAWDNEWDLCEEFGDDDSDDDGDGDDCCEEAVNGSNSSQPGHFDPLDHTVPLEPGDGAFRVGDAEEYHIHEYLTQTTFDRSTSPLLPCEDDHDESDGEGNSDGDDDGDNNLSLLYSEPTRLLSIHYGFVPCLQDIPSSPQDAQQWQRALLTLGINSVIAPDSLLSSIEKAMCRFVTALSQGKRPCDENWDLCDGNRQALVYSPRFSISRPAPDLFVFSHPPSPSCHWVLGLTNAADALYAYRLIDQHRVNIYGVARFLIEQGVPFRTLLSLPHVHLPSTGRKRVTPIRLRGYRFTPHDYAAYLRERAAILSQPNGHAALLQGGILWRLALQSLSPDAALQGPSDAVTANRAGYSTDELEDGLALWDDELTVVEKDLICGLYECRTGLFMVYIYRLFSDCYYRAR